MRSNKHTNKQSIRTWRIANASAVAPTTSRLFSSQARNFQRHPLTYTLLVCSWDACHKMTTSLWLSQYLQWWKQEQKYKTKTKAGLGLPLGTLFLTIWRTALFLCLSSEPSLNIFFSHRTSTPSAFEVITEMRYINYLLTYLIVIKLWSPIWTKFIYTTFEWHQQYERE